MWDYGMIQVEAGYYYKRDAVYESFEVEPLIIENDEYDEEIEPRLVEEGVDFENH